MKKRYLILSGLLAFTLAACSQEKPATSETQTSTEEKTVQEGTAGSKSQEASQKKAEVVNKGDHYSIQGKYDEIVVANKHYPMSKDYNPGENPTAKAELLNKQDSRLATTTVVLEVTKLKLSFIKTM